MLARRTSLCALAVLTALFASACDLFEEKPPSWSEAQIQPERGVGGIEIRMTSAAVANAFGIHGTEGERASLNTVAADPSFYIEAIRSESHERSLRIAWKDVPEDDVADFYVNRVEGVHIDRGFAGKDAKGVGIGSGRDAVESAYGEYEGYVHFSGNGTLTYCRGRNVVRFFVTHDIVDGIYVGVFDPQRQGDVECTR